MQEPFLELSADEFIMHPFDTLPIENFEFPINESGEKFPFCCEHHRGIYENAEEWFTKFPNCCARHIKMSSQKNFIRNTYRDIPMKIVKQIVYTEFHIQERIGTENWYKDITDYIEYNLKSFGHPQVGIEKYYGSIQEYIKCQKKIIRPDKRKLLLEYMRTQLSADKDEFQHVSLNALHSIYQKWIKAFPFELSFFEPLKKQFKNKLPLMDGQVEYNQYLGTVKGKIITPAKLIDSLIFTTKSLLSKIDTADLLRKGLITDHNKHQIELANQSHRIKQSSLLEAYSTTEIRYITILKTWLNNEKAYFQEILPLIAKQVNNIKPEPNKIDRLSSALEKYQFEQLPKVASLKDTGRKSLVAQIAIKELPYQIAMLRFLGFIDYLRKHYFRTNEKLFKELAAVLKANERAVKGNIYVLNSKSTENKSRYTAHLHIDEVTKDYEKMK